MVTVGMGTHLCGPGEDEATEDKGVGEIVRGAECVCARTLAHVHAHTSCVYRHEG